MLLFCVSDICLRRVLLSGTLGVGCSACDATTGVCNQCDAGYQLASGSCSACNAGTQFSTTGATGSCQACASSFILFLDDVIVILAGILGTGCSSCASTTGACNQCNAGYELASGSCSACTAGTQFSTTGSASSCQSCLAIRGVIIHV